VDYDSLPQHEQYLLDQLWTVCTEGDEATLHHVLTKLSVSLDTRDKRRAGKTGLIFAAEKNNLECMKLLLVCSFYLFLNVLSFTCRQEFSLTFIITSSASTVTITTTTTHPSLNNCRKTELIRTEATTSRALLCSWRLFMATYQPSNT